MISLWARIKPLLARVQKPARYIGCEDGAITQMVGEELRAWHAGLSSWQGETDTNSRSIGIEIVNPGHEFGYPEFPGA
ncbi:MAG: N-acetylmuramoyl-L-alanine amidase, partial [Actinomycetota bacterium]